MYNGTYSINNSILPVQSVPLKVKLAKPKDGDGGKVWSHQCMDALESIGRSQFNENLKLIENYEMLRGLS